MASGIALNTLDLWSGTFTCTLLNQIVQNYVNRLLRIRNVPSTQILFTYKPRLSHICNRLKNVVQAISSELIQIAGINWGAIVWRHVAVPVPAWGPVRARSILIWTRLGHGLAV